MAWDIIPNTRVKCQAAVKKCNMKPEVAREVMRLWDHIQSNYPDEPDPLAFSSDESGGKKEVKIMRIVQKKGYKKKWARKCFRRCKKVLYLFHFIWK